MEEPEAEKPAEQPPPPPVTAPPEPPAQEESKGGSTEGQEGESAVAPSQNGSAKGSDKKSSPPEGEGAEHGDVPQAAIQTTREPSAARAKLPANKAIDFQVRVRVIEGRNISGSNISPVVKVNVSNQARQTRVKKSTNKPFFDEIFFFNFKSIASELFDQALSFEVFNSRKLRSNAMIGTFSSDVGFFYDQKDHAIIRRWLLLTDPEDIMSGAKGYLKITVMVLGPGDEAPDVSESAGKDDEDDLEENLLQPAGAMLRPAVFSLKVVRLEDIPQMDSAFTESLKKVFSVGEKSKALVDPYFMMTFAGKQSKTKYIPSNDNPEINQELSVKFQLPSMCEKLKLQIWDWDKIGSDDLVGTVNIPLSAMSGQGDKELGFLPTFGPCFINFYGSTREYSNLPNECEELNEGIGEGVAYRGRALVQLETRVTGEMETGVEDLEDDDVVLLQCCLRRRKFKLFGCFLEATMIACKDVPIQFEISIGNYGNRLDQSVPPSSSSTPSSNAVFDGCYYYYLPYGSTKPCCSVDSHWEDISFRLLAINMLLDICTRLEANIEKVKVGINGNLSKPEIAVLIMTLLEELIVSCRIELPEIKKGAGVTQLDFKKNEVRISELNSIEKEANQLRESATDVNEALHEIETYLQRLKTLAIEPQNSIPDVIIWMLSGSKRIAYHRIPANEILYAHGDNKRGKHCGKVQNIFMKYPGNKQFDIEDHPEVPCQISVMMWLGLEQDQDAWTNRSGVEGDFGVFAETYENQMKFLGKWTTKGLMRPAWSDAEGTVKLLKENFVAPRGWRWDGDWKVVPEQSAAYDSDTGHKTFLDDVYECESRLPGGHWAPAEVLWTDMYGNKAAEPSKIECPEGWKWTMEWKVDINRAVDENGWEYSVDQKSGSYIAVEKMYHLYRRRRVVRSRTLKIEQQASIDEEGIADMLEEGGWEHAISFTSQFHGKERTADMVRRRRWHRRIIQEDPRAPAIFRQSGIDPATEGKKKEKAKADSADVPRMMITFEEPHKYQLRVYLFQARDLLPADADGLSDPYARVIFQNQSQVTRCINRTLCPTWDQTLVFDNLLIYGSKEFIDPQVVIEIFDKDEVGKDEYMGRCMAKPAVKLNGAGPPAPRLTWFPVYKGKEEGGEILAAFELFLDEGTDLPFMPPKNESYFIVPSGIRPVQQRTAIEVLCWGVRNMKKFQLANVTSPSVEFECGGHVIKSEVIKNTQKTPNFEQPLFFFDVMLPREELYIPPMNIKVRDNRSFGRCPVVGVHCLKSLQAYRYDTPEDDGEQSEGSVDGDVPDSGYEMSVKDEKKKTKEVTIDWWSKYYASIGAQDKSEGYLENGNDTIIVYNTELERVEHFKRFQDFVVTFPLYRGKVKTDEDRTDVGEFKGTFRVYPLPNDPNVPLPKKMIHSLPPSQPVECVIRVYIVKAFDLQPMDPNGLADPYVVLTLGKKKIKDQDNYLPNTLNPVFGKMFEMTAAVPVVKDLEIAVYDYDLIGSDDEIGKTVIDLENRFMSRFRPTCGLPQSYCTSGINKWRDSQTPKQILEKYCQEAGYPKPKFKGNTRLIVNGQLYRLEEFEEGTTLHQDLGPADERLALHVLNGQPLVPEHVETRALYSSLQPDIEQGKLQLWVDIFPKELGPPGPPFDVSPRIPQEFELRIIIWNTSDVILEETNIMGEAMSDIYVKGWIAGIDQQQKTDVHFRSLDGTGNFNWRLVFPFLYIPAEKVMVVRKKRHIWSLDMTESRMPPRLALQIWDNDMFSPDDFLGQLELVLNNMPKPTKNSKTCTLAMMNIGKDGKIDKSPKKPVEMVSLFDMKRVYGWWPCTAQEGDNFELTGKIEMTLEVLPIAEATEKPAGKGRSDPNLNPTLDPPNRPATSFNWFSSPFKSLRYILWRRYKWYIIGFLVTVALFALVVLFFYSMPGYTVKKIFGV